MRTARTIKWLLVAAPMLAVFALFIVVEVPALAGHTRTDAPCFVNVHGERVCVTRRAVCSTDAECEGLNHE